MEIADAGAIVFGGASGLGGATARRLAAAGAQVVIADIDESAGDALAREIGAGFLATDVTDAGAVEDAVHAAAEADGGLRVAITCAGVGASEKIVGREGAAALDGFRRVIEINLLGTINVLRLAAQAMSTNAPDDQGERGVCINTASIAAFDGQIGQVAYAASKGGIVGLTLPAARDLAALGVRVVTIAPGIFDTPLLAGLPERARVELGKAVPFPPRLGDPAEFGALALHVVANPMLNGEVIRLDGALRMAPR